MRRMSPFLVAALLTAVGCASSGGSSPAVTPEPAKPQQSSTFEPAQGVTCDRTTQACEWRGGTSVGLTRLFFGDGAADTLAPGMAAAGYEFDPIFKPDTRVSCDTLVTTCYDEGGASADHTRSYFGGTAAQHLEKRSRTTVQRYGQFITCDKLSNICYDRLGAGIGVTRLYLGETEADQLLKRLRSGS